MKQAAVLCASGIGDGLLMMIAAHHLQLEGYEVSLFHSAAEILSPLFKGVTFLPHPPIENLEKTLQSFDQVIVQNDHSARAWHLFTQRKNLPQLTFFFPSSSSQIKSKDYLFNSQYPIATNIAQCCTKLLNKECSKENGLSLPHGKTYRKNPKRVILHPTSNDPKRNWHKTQFLKLEQHLKKDGYEVAFCISPSEKVLWKDIKNAPHFNSLDEVAAYIYESGYLIGNDSGIGHLASNLGIPTLTISGNPKRVRLWRPDWALGRVVTLPFPLPNFKGINLRIRENFWQHFIPVRRTLKVFKQLVQKYETTA